MICTNCGAENRDAAAYCSTCGAPLASTPSYGNLTQQPAPSAAKKNITPLIVALSIALILTIGVGAFALVSTSHTADADTAATNVAQKKGEKDSPMVLIAQNFVTTLFSDEVSHASSTEEAMSSKPVVEHVLPYIRREDPVYQKFVDEVTNNYSYYADNSSYSSSLSETNINEMIQMLIENYEVQQIDEDTYRVIVDYIEELRKQDSAEDYEDGDVEDDVDDEAYDADDTDDASDTEDANNDAYDDTDDVYDDTDDADDTDDVYDDGDDDEDGVYAGQSNPYRDVIDVVFDDEGYITDFEHLVRAAQPGDDDYDIDPVGTAQQLLTQSDDDTDSAELESDEDDAEVSQAANEGDAEVSQAANEDDAEVSQAANEDGAAGKATDKDSQDDDDDEDEDEDDEETTDKLKKKAKEIKDDVESSLGSLFD